ncbi:MAG: glycoside hydrolase family 5 protein [Armatimonadota bacterium]
MIRVLTVGFVLGCVLLSPAIAQAQPPRVGDVVFQTDFEEGNPLAGWAGAGRIEPGYQSDHCIAFERLADATTTSATGWIKLPVERLRGCLLHFHGMIKAENVSEKPNSWNGVKFMVPITTPGGKLYPQARIGTGTFDWQQFVFPVRVPEDAIDVQLYLGLEAVSGKAWFDNLRVVVRKLPFVPRPAATGGPVYRGHDLPRLRGAMISPNITEESLRLLGQEWKANLVRWQLVGWRPQGQDFDLVAYDAWLADQLAKLDAALPLCEKYGLYVVVDLHNAPGGGPDSGKTLFSDRSCQNKFIENWRMMARKYCHSRVVWGYDLVNEPLEDAVADGVDDWQTLAERTAKAIREIDSEHAIIVEAPAGGNPYGLTQFNPIDVPKVVYSVHMYLPHSFTHQGVHGQWTKRYSYPGEIDGKHWDKTQLEAALKPAIDFQKRYNVHMYIGEFSAIRWAPDNSAYRYLRDLIDLFEANDWDWSYHAFREWSGWSVEHGPDRDDTRPVDTPTDRQKLLLDWFAKNRKPAWMGEPG